MEIYKNKILYYNDPLAASLMQRNFGILFDVYDYLGRQRFNTTNLCESLAVDDYDWTFVVKDESKPKYNLMEDDVIYLWDNGIFEPASDAHKYTLGTNKNYINDYDNVCVVLREDQTFIPPRQANSLEDIDDEN